MADVKTDLAKDSSWVNRAREAYESGASDIEVCKAIGITRATFDNYYNSNDSFKKFVDFGRMLASAWWYERGRKNLENKSFNTSLWTFNMKNRFGWADKMDQTSGVDPNLDSRSEDEIRSMYNQLRKKMEKYGKKTQADLLEETSGGSIN